MPDTYTGSISTGKLQVDGNLNIYPDASGSIASSLRAVEINAVSVTASTINVDIFNFEQANIDISGNLIVLGDTTLNTAYISRLEVGTLIIDTSGDVYQSLDILENLTVGGTIVTDSGFSVDLSGNVNVSGDTTLNTAYISRLEVGTLIIDTSGDVYQSLDILGNLTVGGTIVTDSGFSLDLSGNVMLPRSMETASGFSIDSLGNVMFPGTLETNSGFSIDISGNVMVNGSTSVQAFIADGQVSLNHNVYVGENIAIMGGEYLQGSIYANGGVVVGDSSNGNGVTLNVSGTTLNVFSKDSSNIEHPVELVVGSLNVSGFSVDLSGNIMLPGTMATDSGFFIDLSGNVMLPGTMATDSGFSIDLSGNVMLPGTMATDSGFSIDSLGNVMFPGTMATDSSFFIDLSGNVSVAGNTSVQSFLVGGQAYLSNNLNVAENTAIEGGFYVGGSIYANGGVVVGDTIDGDGVTMDVSGTTLNVYSEDISGNIIPIDINVNGSIQGVSFNVNDSYAFNTFTDSSGTFINIDSSNNSVIENTTTVPNKQIVISINGVKYSINLFQIV
jgi:cytoskeletal protein CcmA (bactofilin family)